MSLEMPGTSKRSVHLEKDFVLGTGNHVCGILNIDQFTIDSFLRGAYLKFRKYFSWLVASLIIVVKSLLCFQETVTTPLSVIHHYTFAILSATACSYLG